MNALDRADREGNEEDARDLAEMLRAMPKDPVASAEPPAPAKPGGPDVGALEAGARGAIDMATFGFGDEIAAGSGALIDKLSGNAPDLGERYRELRDSERERDASAFEQHPGWYRTGEGAALIAQIGPKGIVALGKLGVNVAKNPGAVLSAIKSVGSLEGAAKALTAGGKGAAVGAGAGGAAGLGQSDADLTQGEYAEAAEDTLEGARTGAALGAPLGAGGAMLEAGTGRLAGKAAVADDIARKATELESLQGGAPASGKLAEAEARLRPAIDDLQRQQAALPARNAADAAQGAAERKALEASELSPLQKELDELGTARGELEARAAGEVRAAEEAFARSPEAQGTPLQRVGLENKQSVLGGPAKAGEKAEALVGDERLMAALRDNPPGPAQDAAIKAILDEVGGRLDTTYTAMAGNKLAFRNARDLGNAMRATFKKLPDDAGAKAQVFALLKANAPEGGRVSAGAINRLIKKFDSAAGTTEAARAKDSSKIYSAAAGVLRDSRKALVEQHLGGDALAAFKNDLAEYARGSTARRAATEQRRAVQAGRAPVRSPDAPEFEPTTDATVHDARIGELEQGIEGVQAKYSSKMKVAPTDPRYYADELQSLQDELKAAQAASKAETGQRVDTLKSELKASAPESAGRRFGRMVMSEVVGGGLGAAAGHAIMPGIGTVPGGFAGRSIGRILADKWLPVVRRAPPSAAAASASAQKANAALMRYEGAIKAAVAQGPRAMIALNAALMQRDPEYAAVMNEQEQAEVPEAPAQPDPNRPERHWEKSPNAEQFMPALLAAEETYGLPDGLLSRVAYQESRFNPRSRSIKGARGIMQIMPRTAEELGVNPDDPQQAIDGAARYLRQQHDQFGDWGLALAAYNMGPGRLQRSMATGAAWPMETQQYVQQITRDLGGTGELPAAPDVQVTAHNSGTPTGALPAAAAPQGPADIASTPDMDRIALEHYQTAPRSRDRETGFLMEDGLDSMNENTLRIGDPIRGETDKVDFRWKRSQPVRATMHDHPKNHRGFDSARSNASNAKPSEEDEALVRQGRVPAYVRGSDGKLRVLEMRGGQIVVREVNE